MPIFISQEAQSIADRIKKDFSSLSEYERAERVAKIFSVIPSSGVSTHGRLRGIVKLMGISIYAAHAYQVLYLAGELADDLWSRILDGKMSLGTANRLLRDARRQAKTEKKDVSDLLVVAIALWEAYPRAAAGEKKRTRSPRPKMLR